MKTWSIILRVQVVTLGLLAVGSFTVSYQGLWDYALTLGFPPRIAWICPLILDAIAVAFSLCAYASALKRRRNNLATSLVLAFLGVSVWYQVQHAIVTGLVVDFQSVEFWSTCVFHALAPVALFWLLEVLVRQALDEHGEIVKKQKREDRMRVVRGHRKAQKVSDSQIASAIASCATKKQAAASLGISEATLHRRVKGGAQ